MYVKSSGPFRGDVIILQNFVSDETDSFAFTLLCVLHHSRVFPTA